MLLSHDAGRAITHAWCSKGRSRTLDGARHGLGVGGGDAVGEVGVPGCPGAAEAVAEQGEGCRVEAQDVGDLVHANTDLQPRNSTRQAAVGKGQDAQARGALR